MRIMQPRTILFALLLVACEAAKKKAKKGAPVEPESVFPWKMWGLVAWLVTCAAMVGALYIKDKPASTTEDPAAPQEFDAPAPTSWESRVDRGSTFHVKGTSTRS